MRVLVVDDERKMGVILQDALREEGHEVEALTASRDALERLRTERFDLLVTDLKMAPPDGLELLREARASHPGLAVILMTAYATAQTAVEAMKAGAYDYLVKPFELDELRLRVRKLERERELGNDVRALERENALLKEAVGSTLRLGQLVGKSPLMRDVLQLAEKVAATDATVLIRGESGTGKSLLARAIHGASGRAGGPLVTVNCGALPETLLESELFGHEKGAFTGAVGAKRGRFAAAEGGTIFLDEVGEMTPALQVKLLQVLEDRTFFPVGSEKPVEVDVRVIAATNRDLEAAMEEGEFREDLFYRLNVFPLPLPPLRAHKEDLPLLTDHLLARWERSAGDLDQEARKALLAHDFPGNVRELENHLERAVILAGPGPIGRQHFPGLDRGPGSGREGARSGSPMRLPEGGLSLEELERDLILQALDQAGGNKTRAAQLLGLTRRTLYSRMERHGLSLRRS